MWMKPIFFCGVLLLAAGCGPRDAKEAMPKTVAKVFVDEAGQIFLNGSKSDLDHLKVEFARLKSVGGAVEYSRANPAGEPPPNAMDVIAAITEASLPVRLLGPPS